MSTASSLGQPRSSGDIKALLQEQQEALKRTIFLNQLIKRWTDEHAPALAEPPARMSDTSLTVKSNKMDKKDLPVVVPIQNRSHASSAVEELNRTWSSLSQKSPRGSQSPRSPQPVSGAGKVSPVGDPPRVVKDSLSTPLLPASSASYGQKDQKSSRTSLHNMGVGAPSDEPHQHHKMERSARLDRLLFPKASDSTLRVQAILDTPEETIEDLYTKDGTFQAIARSKRFEKLSLMVILLNTIWIAIDTDYNHAEVLIDAPLVFIIVDNIFCCFFVSELFIRLMAFKRKLNAFGDSWYVFDSGLVALMVWETWIQVLLYEAFGSDAFQYGRAATILRVFRLARLSRVARTGKLLRSVPELMILAKAMFLALRSVMAVLVMLTLVIYVFAILFTQLLAGEDLAAGKFDSVPMSMNYLLIQLLCGFDSSFIFGLVKAGLIYYGIFLLFILVANMTIMNMLIGILCDVVAGVSEAEKEQDFVKDIENHLKAAKIKNTSADTEWVFDADGDKKVSKDEFEMMVQDAELVKDLQSTGVDVVSFVEYASFVFQDQENAQLSTSDFLKLIVQFRGDRLATVKELVSTRKYMTNLFESMQFH